MAWVRLEGGFPEHRKIIGLSDAAFRLHIVAICYAARMLSDGIVPRVWLTGGKGRIVPKAVDQLVSAGVWESRDDGDFDIHDYLKYQPSRDVVTDKRDAAAVRMQHVRTGHVRRLHNKAAWDEMLQAYDHKCLKCGGPNPTQDHVIPVCDGGRDNIQNLQPLCQSCNSSKGRNRTDYRVGHPATRQEWLRSHNVRANDFRSSQNVHSTQSLPIPIPSDPETTKTSSVASAPLVLSPLAFAKAREKFTFFGARLRVPHVLHEEFRSKLGGVDPHQRLVDWYEQVNAEAEQSGEPIPDVFEWLRPRFKAWASDHMATAELEKFRPKGA